MSRDHHALKAVFPTDDVRAKMLRVKAEDVERSTSLHEVIHTIIECEAKSHGTVSNDKRFGNVLDAIKRGKIQACLIYLEKDGMLGFGGGAIEFPTVLTYWNGEAFDHFPAIYREDIFTLPQMSSEFRQGTKCEEFPRGVGLGTHLTFEEVKASTIGEQKDRPFGMIAHGLLGEYAPDNAAIINSLGKLRSVFGEMGDSAVLCFPDVASPIAQKGFPRVEKEFLAPDDSDITDICQNIFTVSWKSIDEKQQIVASFTEAFSTFNGEAVVRVQLTSNGALPEEKTLKDVLTALIWEGEREIVKRGWTEKTGMDLVRLMRFHILKEPKVISAFKALEAEPRLLGHNIMLPITLSFLDIPHNYLGFFVPEASPLICISANHKIYNEEFLAAQNNSKMYAVA